MKRPLPMTKVLRAARKRKRFNRMINVETAKQKQIFTIKDLLRMS